MACSTGSSGTPSTCVQWMWNSNKNPFAKSLIVEWIVYSDVENIIIEEAFASNKTHAMLDDYHIDFHCNLQILNTDGKKQRPVKRVIRDKDDYSAREDRFAFVPIDPKRPFTGTYGWISPFIKETVKFLNITPQQLPSKDNRIISVLVEMAAQGIVEEGKLLGKQIEGEKIAELLLKKKEADMHTVWERCAYIYSLTSFVYMKLNETMRLIGSAGHEHIWRSKIGTLGPFSLLLWDSPSNYNSVKPKTILYRGAQLTEETISFFKDDCLQSRRPNRSFPAFTSCSRNREVAEAYGNTLFIMEIQHAFTVDLQPFSQFPDEEEELLSPGVCFTVDFVESDERKNRHWIFLKLKQMHTLNVLSGKDAQEISIALPKSNEPRELKVMMNDGELLAILLDLMSKGLTHPSSNTAFASCFRTGMEGDWKF
ncbi:unnamed protein product [Adineta ricciae]|uniref:NAD(P)(+)--arginine ADP-ribosyltransferase n=1 Tax=Adineta ricciae TaxID=249248 RepID=A0A815P1F4_ADIRI|nr:unnamed protein product [Adineta ricciae]